MASSSFSASLVASVLISATLAASTSSCKALVMSGGGSNGAWEAGVVWGLVNYGDTRDYAYDVVIGTSIGAINTLAFAVHEVGDEIAAADFLVDVWDDLHSEDVWQRWSLTSMLSKPSFLDTMPGFSTLRDLLQPFEGYKRSVSFSAVDINTGHIVNLTDEVVPFEEAHIAAIASASYPPFFPPTPYRDMLLVDGNTAYNTNAQAAVDRCRELVDDDSQITIDVLICGSEGQVHPIDSSGNAWQNYWRTVDIQSQTRNYNSLQATQRGHPNITWRHTINQNDHKVPDRKELSFDPELSAKLIELGKEDAMKALQKGEQADLYTQELIETIKVPEEVTKSVEEEIQGEEQFTEST